MAKLATETQVDQGELLDFVRPRNQWVLTTLRQDGRPQVSPVTGGVGPNGQLLIATYPFRDKVHNLRRDPRVTICVLSDHFGGSWVQVDGQATVTDVPDAVEGLVEYYQAVTGEHPNWEEYRASMLRQGKSLLRIDIERWGPVATGGFPGPVLPPLDGTDGTPTPPWEAAEEQAIPDQHEADEPADERGNEIG